MKKLIIMLLVSVPLFSLAQSDTTRAQPKEQYCMLIASEKFLSAKFNVTVDFGDETKILTKEDQVLKGKLEKGGKFNSIIDALNYMAKQGWLFVNAYSLPDGANATALHYVLRRPVVQTGQIR
jgi:hypothetical protein